MHFAIDCETHDWFLRRIIGFPNAEFWTRPATVSNQQTARARTWVQPSCGGAKSRGVHLPPKTRERTGAYTNWSKAWNATSRINVIRAHLAEFGRGEAARELLYTESKIDTDPYQVAYRTLLQGCAQRRDSSNEHDLDLLGWPTAAPRSTKLGRGLTDQIQSEECSYRRPMANSGH
jgi:hypothetical protein